MWLAVFVTTRGRVLASGCAAAGRLGLGGALCEAYADGRADPVLGEPPATLVAPSPTEPLSHKRRNLRRAYRLRPAAGAVHTPTKIPFADEDKPPHIIQAAAGAAHSLFLTDAGSLFATGLGIHGQLGLVEGAGARGHDGYDAVLEPAAVEWFDLLVGTDGREEGPRGRGFVRVPAALLPIAQVRPAAGVGALQPPPSHMSPALPHAPTNSGGRRNRPFRRGLILRARALHRVSGSIRLWLSPAPGMPCLSRGGPAGKGDGSNRRHQFRLRIACPALCRQC